MQNHKHTAAQAFRFVLVGIFATALHYGIYLLLRCAIQIDVAYTIGYVLSFLANFYLTARFTFRTAPSWRRLVGMGGAHGVNYVLHMVLLNLFLWLGVPPALAPLPVFAVAVPVNFILVKVVFKNNRKQVDRLTSKFVKLFRLLASLTLISLQFWI